MKKLMIVLAVAITSCTSRVKTEQHSHENLNEPENKVTVLQLNNGSKWKADEATKRNVAAMMQVISDSSYVYSAKRSELFANLQGKVDVLIKECRMKGPEHDALHVWLESVLKGMKKLKESDSEYSDVYAVLKKDIESFNAFFE